MKKINNKGFTLVELLAVLVILVAIMSIAIPTINSALERSKKNQTKQVEKILGSAASLYVSDHRRALKDEEISCINVGTLVDEGYVTDEETEDVNGNPLSGCFDVNSFEYSTECSNCR